MNKTTISDLVEAQPDEVDIQQLIEQLCLLRQLDCADDAAAARELHDAEVRLEHASAAFARN